MKFMLQLIKITTSLCTPFIDESIEKRVLLVGIQQLYLKVQHIMHSSINHIISSHIFSLCRFTRN